MTDHTWNGELYYGYWYVKSDVEPGWEIVKVSQNPLQDHRFEVFQIDEYGSCGPSEFRFLGPVGSPRNKDSHYKILNSENQHKAQIERIRVLFNIPKDKTAAEIEDFLVELMNRQAVDHRPVRDATKQCFVRYLSILETYSNEKQESYLSRDCRISHLKWMCETCISNIYKYPVDKLNRWLGFVQGVCVMQGILSVEEERNWSRPVFHKAYKDEQQNVPPTLNPEN